MCFFARMSDILSSLNKSGQFMSDEKKKGGFWSWFGLGKNKQETSTEPKAPESQKPLSHEPETQDVAQETAEKTTALSESEAEVQVESAVDIEDESVVETEEHEEENTLMAQASTLVPELHEVQSESTQSEEDGAHAVKRAPSVEVETAQEENLTAQAWTLAPSGGVHHGGRTAISKSLALVSQKRVF